MIREKAQEIDLSIVENLGSSLLLFVDSTHTLGPVGEVTRIVLEMLPHLNSGAVAHFHDINYPYGYTRNVLDSALFFGTRLHSSLPS